MTRRKGVKHKGANDPCPWKRVYKNMLRRTNPKSKAKGTVFYRKHNIRVLVSEADVKKLWFKWGADQMKNPQCHRVDNFDDYCYDNIRFIERWEHNIISKIERWNRGRMVSIAFRLWIEQYLSEVKTK